jgi:hypothetical protein
MLKLARIYSFSGPNYRGQWVLVFFISWGGVSLSPLGTSATVWPIIPAPDGT